jgi:hypothetical protein
LYEIHFDIKPVRGLKWYVGTGAHVGLYKHLGLGNTNFVGIDGVLGLDYKVKGVPLNISLELNPTYEFTEYTKVIRFPVGLGVRYTF